MKKLYNITICIFACTILSACAAGSYVDYNSTKENLGSYSAGSKERNSVLLGRVNVVVDGVTANECRLVIYDRKSTASKAEKDNNHIEYTIDSSGLVAIPIEGIYYDLSHLYFCKGTPTAMRVSNLDLNNSELWRWINLPIEKGSLVYFGDVTLDHPPMSKNVVDKFAAGFVANLAGAPASQFRDVNLIVEDNLEKTLREFRSKTGDQNDYKIKTQLHKEAK